MIEPVTYDLAMPQGYVTVDLIDADSGRVVQREEGENFLTTLSTDHAKWWQRQMWGRYNPVEIADVFGFYPSNARTFPAEQLGYWNDATAESPSTETRVETPLVGWASRHPVGSPSGTRGVVNITESAWTEAQAKWVFDWTTSQGNGTFQSVGWTRIYEAQGVPWMAWPEAEILSFTPVAGAATSNSMQGLWWDGTAWFTFDQSSSTVWRIVTMPAAGGQAVPVVTLPSTIANSTNPAAHALINVGTDWIIVGSNSTNPTVARMNAAGTQLWRRTESLASVRYMGVTINGSGECWVFCTDSRLRQLSLSDGTVLATVGPISVGTITPSTGGAIAYDAADGGYWLSFYNPQTFVKVNASGVATGPQMNFQSSDSFTNSTAPFAGSFYVPASRMRDEYQLYWGEHSVTTSGSFSPRNSMATATAPGSNLSQGVPPLTMRDGLPWSGWTPAATQIQRASPFRGRNLASRVLLPSPVTKLSSQALKITYTFTFS